MAKIFIVGTYDCTLESLLQVDLMQYFERLSLSVSGVLYKTSNGVAPRRGPSPQKIEWKNCTTIWTEDFNDPNTVKELAACQPDLLIYAGGRDILRQPLLDAARLGCLGGHYGELPTIRGMGTVEWSVLSGIEPAVAIQRIDAGIDTGDIVMQAKVPLVKDDTFTDIRDRSYAMTKMMLALAAEQLLSGKARPVMQDKEQGRQYFRMHPAILDVAVEKLSKRLSQAYG